MRTIRNLTLAVSALLYATAPAHADINTLINFDDLTIAKNTHVIVGDPATGLYQGLSWSNFFAEANAGDHVGIAGYAEGVVSYPNAAYVDGKNFTGSIFDPTDGSTFLFKSAYFTSTASNGNSGATRNTDSIVHVIGIDLSGNTDCGVGKSVACLDALITINDHEATQHQFNWTVIGVTFEAIPSTPTSVPFDLVVDNLLISTAPISSPVPEPGAVFLFGVVGAAVLPLIRRRFRQA